jgi:hypothetical protein
VTFSVRTSDGSFDSDLTVPITSTPEQYEPMIAEWLQLMHAALLSPVSLSPVPLEAAPAVPTRPELLHHTSCGGSWSVVAREDVGEYKDVQVFECDRCKLRSMQPQSPELDALDDYFKEHGK